MIDKSVATYREAIDGLKSGHTVMVGGFGIAGVPRGLIAAVLQNKPDNLTVISNNAGFGSGDITDWLEAGLVRKVICTYPRTSPKFIELYRQGKVELELIPQGTLAERIRCAGAGLGGFLSPVAAGTLLAEGKERRVIDGREYILEWPLSADFTFIRAKTADRMGNLTYNMTARNFAPVMAMAAQTVVVEAETLVETGSIDPETVVTPGILIDRVVQQGSVQ